MVILSLKIACNHHKLQFKITPKLKYFNGFCHISVYWHCNLVLLVSWWEAIFLQKLVGFGSSLSLSYLICSNIQYFEVIWKNNLIRTGYNSSDFMWIYLVLFEAFQTILWNMKPRFYLCLRCFVLETALCSYWGIFLIRNM